MHRRKLLALSAIGVSLPIAGCAGTEDDGDGRRDDTDPGGDDGGDDSGGGDTEPTDDSGDGTEPSNDTSDDDDEPEPEPELTTLASIMDVADRYDPGAESFSGTGQDVTDQFGMGGAMTAAIFEHDGETNFQPELLDDEGQTVEFIANEIGQVLGATAFPLEAGDYMLDVYADGSWTVELAQPLAPDEDVHQLPVESSGEGHDVVGPVRLDGQATVTGTHDGDSNFQVEILDEDATDIFGTEYVFNEIGEFEGSTSITMDAYAWVSVTADGEWTLDVE